VAATNLMIARTGAILVYGQERASVSSAIARRLSLLLFSPSFRPSWQRPALSVTRLDASSAPLTCLSQLGSSAAG